MDFEVQVQKPSELSTNEIARCVSLIREGGAVESSAENGVRNALHIAIVRGASEIVGVGAIKARRPQYAIGISRRCGFAFDENMLELGYVARAPHCRGQNLSDKIVSGLLAFLPGVSLFATTSSEKMKQTLKCYGFMQRGNEWLGNNQNRLSLWVKETKA